MSDLAPTEPEDRARGALALENSVRAQIASGPPGAPAFYVVGHPKCGTTALYDMLREQPGVFMPDRKEPGFFSTDLRYSPEPRARGGQSETYEEYVSLFAAAAADQLTGEASTSYIWSRSAPSLIAAARPDARIIDIVREPAALIRSLHMQLLENRSEEVTDLRTALELQEPRRQGRELTRLASRRPQALMYTDRVHYVEQLRRFGEQFGAEQMLVLVYDDFRADNEGTMRRVQRFLGLDDTLPFKARESNLTTARRVGVDEKLRTLTTGSGLAAKSARGLARAITPRTVRRTMLRAVEERVVFASPPPPDERLMRELRRRFKGEVEALAEYLDRDLVAEWGYEGLQ
jgi:hypothetical protein